MEITEEKTEAIVEHVENIIDNNKEQIVEEIKETIEHNVEDAFYSFDETVRNCSEYREDNKVTRYNEVDAELDLYTTQERMSKSLTENIAYLVLEEIIIKKIPKYIYNLNSS